MYSGITAGLYPVSSLEKKPGLFTYSVLLDMPLLQGLSIGDSVNIDGVCQTVTKMVDGHVFFDAMAETLRITTLSCLQLGQKVSVARSLKIGDEHGGHDVYGHIIGTAVVHTRDKHTNNLTLCFRVNPEWMPYIQHKGFVALNGSSLTVLTRDDLGFFSVALIPETLTRTLLGELVPGDEVNLEIDAKTQAIVETVSRVLAAREKKLAK